MTNGSSRPEVELLDLVDELDHVIGQAARGDAYAHRLRHRCVFVLVRDGHDRVFVHRRPTHKLLFPSRYDMFVGGAVAAGETCDEAARREATEELGVYQRLAPVPVLKFLYETPEHAWWCAVYCVRCDAPVNPPAAEVSWYSFLSETELRMRLTDWPWAPDSLEAYRDRKSVV